MAIHTWHSDDGTPVKVFVTVELQFNLRGKQ